MRSITIKNRYWEDVITTLAYLFLIDVEHLILQINTSHNLSLFLNKLIKVTYEVTRFSCVATETNLT